MLFPPITRKIECLPQILAKSVPCAKVIGCHKPTHIVAPRVVSFKRGTDANEKHLIGRNASFTSNVYTASPISSAIPRQSVSF